MVREETLKRHFTGKTLQTGDTRQFSSLLNWWWWGEVHDFEADLLNNLLPPKEQVFHILLTLKQNKKTPLLKKQ
jgi:hypothetical protein